jgi:chromosomal replication initiator protein
MNLAEINLPPTGLVGFSLWRGNLSTPKRWTMADIARFVCEAYKIDMSDLTGTSQARRFSVPRQHAMWLMDQQPHTNRVMIGKFLGNRDHTTVLHGVKAHEARSTQ